MAVLDCLVTGYESLTPTLQLPDPKDRHVLAAAIFGGARAIVTFNRRHFPASTLAMHGIEALHPDRFMHDLLNLDISEVLEAVRRQREGLRNPTQTAQELLSTLKSQGLSDSMAQLEKYQELL